MLIIVIALIVIALSPLITTCIMPMEFRTTYELQSFLQDPAQLIDLLIRAEVIKEIIYRGCGVEGMCACIIFKHCSMLIPTLCHIYNT